jgi:predicted transcriptional regulator
MGLKKLKKFYWEIRMDEETKKRFEAIEIRLGTLEMVPKNNSPVNESAYDNIFEEQEGKIIVTRTISGKNIREKTKDAALLSLIGYKQKLKETEISASKLRESVATLKIPLENFATYINDLIPQSIMKKAKGKKNVFYKLTTFGEAKAKTLLKEITENETNTSK